MSTAPESSPGTLYGIPQKQLRSMAKATALTQLIDKTEQQDLETLEILVQQDKIALSNHQRLVQEIEEKEGKVVELKQKRKNVSWNMEQSKYLDHSDQPEVYAPAPKKKCESMTEDMFDSTDSLGVLESQVNVKLEEGPAVSLSEILEPVNTTELNEEEEDSIRLFQTSPCYESEAEEEDINELDGNVYHITIQVAEKESTLVNPESNPVNSEVSVDKTSNHTNDEQDTVENTPEDIQQVTNAEETEIVSNTSDSSTEELSNNNSNNSNVDLEKKSSLVTRPTRRSITTTTSHSNNNNTNTTHIPRVSSATLNRRARAESPSTRYSSTATSTSIRAESPVSRYSAVHSNRTRAESPAPRTLASTSTVSRRSLREESQSPVRGGNSVNTTSSYASKTNGARVRAPTPYKQRTAPTSHTTSVNSPDIEERARSTSRSREFVPWNSSSQVASHRVHSAMKATIPREAVVVPTSAITRPTVQASTTITNTTKPTVQPSTTTNNTTSTTNITTNNTTNNTTSTRSTTPNRQSRPSIRETTPVRTKYTHTPLVSPRAPPTASLPSPRTPSRTRIRPTSPSPRTAPTVGNTAIEAVHSAYHSIHQRTQPMPTFSSPTTKLRQSKPDQ